MNTAKNKDVDLEGDGDGYSGTFRWKKSKQLLNMPPCPPTKLDLSGGWMEYLLSRAATEEKCVALIGQAQHDLSLIDCLSTPLTVANMCISAGVCNADRPLPCLNIVCIGTSAKAEGRVLAETNCFNELSYIFRNVASIQLYLVGPEMSRTSDRPISLTPNLEAHTFQGTSVDFFRAHSSLIGSDNTVVIGVNCGFGNWENPLPVRYNLLFQWLKDLYFLTATKIPLLFACANDYADLVGEVSVMQNIMGSYFIHPPSANRFEYASTMVAPGALDSHDRKGRDYSRGNSYWYGVQGCDLKGGRRRKVSDGDVRGLMTILATAPLVSCDSLRPPSSQGSTKVRQDSPQLPSTRPIAPVNKKKEEKQSLATHAVAPSSGDGLNVSDAGGVIYERVQQHLPSSPPAAEITIKSLGLTSDDASSSCSESTRPDTDVNRESTLTSHKGSVIDTLTKSEGEQVSGNRRVALFEYIQESHSPSFLTVVVSFNVPISSMVDIELDVGSSNRYIRIKYMSDSAMVELTSAVHPESIHAKFSKKKNQLKIQATIME